MKIYFIVILIVFSVQHLVFGQDKKIELFVNGKGFESVQEYKLERLRQVVEKIYGVRERDKANPIVEKIVQKYSYDAIVSMSDPELTQTVYAEFKGTKPLNQSVQIESVELNDIKHMTNELLKDKKLDKDFKIDPKKVKTLEIKPPSQP
jgi:hypothetical protein